jgi:hypothetical protein
MMSKTSLSVAATRMSRTFRTERNHNLLVPKMLEVELQANSPKPVKSSNNVVASRTFPNYSRDMMRRSTTHPPCKMVMDTSLATFHTSKFCTKFSSSAHYCAVFARESERNKPENFFPPHIFSSLKPRTQFHRSSQLRLATYPPGGREEEETGSR